MNVAATDGQYRGHAWPTLRFADWKDTFETLQVWTQIVGKTRLALAPMQNRFRSPKTVSTLRTIRRPRIAGGAS